ncbi:MAG: prenyltransferase [Actinomycetia bacterium]|nr:prenyltransferase [Actinomycetes bacterium]MCP4961844.1 prenyltransferase [Actinomycetes bacterium]
MQQPEHTSTLSMADIEATADSIIADQQPNGLILWFPGGHADPWNHVEAAMALDVAGRHTEAEAAYQWLADEQKPDGWWHHYYLADGIEDAKIDTNVCAYVATGVWHHWLITGDTGFLETMWPVVERAVDFVLGMQRADGSIVWARHVDGTPWSYALLTGSSSIYHSLGCALRLAETMDVDRTDWEFSAVQLAHAIAHHPDAFEPKERWAMDWYYPVLAGALTGDAAREHLAKGRPTFIMEQGGIRCVSDQPWVTAAETCECAMAYLVAGERDEAVELFNSIQVLRDDDGAYFTGIVYPDNVNFPDHERSTYTSAAVILAADALDDITAAAGVFRNEDLPDLSS